jgi:hypothetical protein
MKDLEYELKHQSSGVPSNPFNNLWLSIVFAILFFICFLRFNYKK